MSQSDTIHSKAPPDLPRIDLAQEYISNESGRTTPSSFHESLVGIGFALLCGSVGFNQIQNQQALVDYYEAADLNTQKEVLQILHGSNKESRSALLIKSLLFACANNFKNKATIKGYSDSELKYFENVEHFNEEAIVNETSRIFNIAKVHEALRTQGSEMMAENMINLMGVLGVKYATAQILFNDPKLIYTGFTSTFNQSVGDNNGINKGPAAWFLYALMRQCYANASCYIVGDLFVVTVHENDSHDEDLDMLLTQIGLFDACRLSDNDHTEGFKLEPIHDNDNLGLVPDQDFITSTFQYLMLPETVELCKEKPQVLVAYLLKLAYTLNTYQGEFDIIVGVLQQLGQFIPDISYVSGVTATTLHALVEHHNKLGGVSLNIPTKFPLTIDVKHMVTGLLTAYRLNFRHYLRNYKVKSWGIDNSRLDPNKHQMLSALYAVVSRPEATDWGINPSVWN